MIHIAWKNYIKNSIETGMPLQVTEMESILGSLEDYERLLNLCLNAFDTKGSVIDNTMEKLKAELGVVSPFKD